MSTNNHPQDFDVTRQISRRVETDGTLPSLSVPQGPEDEGLFKNELAVNSWASGDHVGDAPGIYLRVGAAEREEATDKLVRIGPALVTDDPITALSPDVPYAASSADVVETGEIWYRTTDGALFVHDGGGYARVTPIPATQSQTGIIRVADDLEVIAATDDNLAVPPSGLSNWAEYHELLSRSHEGKQLYVDQSIGDDSLDNDGLDPRYPFLTLDRALLEEARRSFVPGADNDRVKNTSIVLMPGDYLIDNRPGASNFASLTRLSAGASGPINPIKLQELVTDITFTANTIQLTVVGGETAGIKTGSQVWNQDNASGVVTSVSDTEVVIRNPKGTWAIDDEVSFADYSVFNSPNGGVIVPRGCSIVGTDLRKCIIRPRYLGDFDGWLASISGCSCTYVGGTARLRLTGNTYVANITFLDNPDIKATHHICTAFEFASTEDLDNSTYGYYRKVYQVLGNTVSPNIIDAEFQTDSYETNIVSPASSNAVTDSDGFLLLNSVQGASPYISNCSLLSRFGARGLRIDGAVVGGFKSFVVERFTNVSLQDDQRAFQPVTDAPGGKQYLDDWRHASFEAINDGYAQLVSCFTIASGAHYRTRSGGELSLASCFVNFGDIAFTAAGHSADPLPQDIGAGSLHIIPPKPIDTDPQELPLGTFKPVFVESGGVEIAVKDKLYIYEDSFDEARLKPFTLLGGEDVYLRVPSGSTYRAQLVDTAPFYGFDNQLNSFYLNVKSSSNDIADAAEEAQEAVLAGNTDDVQLLDSLVLYIIRTPDLRPQADRIYWLEITGMTGTKRQPQRNFVMQFSASSGISYTLNSTLFVADIRASDTEGNPFNTGTYQIALLQGNGINDNIGFLYPELDVNRPNANSPISKTYLALDALLQAIGLNELQRLQLLVPGYDKVELINAQGSAQSIFLDFLKPSTIRAFGTGLEWVGYLNYDTALPKYQDYTFDLSQQFAKIKNESYGGRVYNVGMTHEGMFVVGEKVIDLRDGTELDVSNPFPEQNKVLKNLTITNRLFLYPNSTLDANGVIVNIDNNTTFGRDIQSTFKTYATEAKAGFVRLATAAEARALTITTAAISPGNIPKADQGQEGIARFATPGEANDLGDSGLDSAYLTMVSPGTIPIGTQTQRGVVRYSTIDEVKAELNVDGTASDPDIRFRTTISPGTLCWSTQTQIGVSRFATAAEAKLLDDPSSAARFTTAIAPGTIPKATLDITTGDTQAGVVTFATPEQAALLNEAVNASRFNTVIAPGTIPIATDSQRGVARFATQEEVELLENSIQAYSTIVAPGTIPKASLDTATNDRQAGIVLFATQSEANSLKLSPAAYTTVLTPGTLPVGSQTQAGIVQLANPTLANDLQDPNAVLTPGTLPRGSQTQRGVVQFATLTEAEALRGTITDPNPRAYDRVLAPGTLPFARSDQPGIARFADQTEAEELLDTNLMLSPGNIPKATEDQEGVVQFANPTQVRNRASTTLCISPANIPIADTQYPGTARFATLSEARSLDPSLTGIMISPATIPLATEAQRGVARFAFTTEVAAEFNTTGDDSDADIRFRTILSPGNVPHATQNQSGITRFATPGEALLLGSSENSEARYTTAIAPGTIPLSSQSQQGIARFADQTEANQLDEISSPRRFDTVIAPGTIPIAKQNQRGVARFADPDEAKLLSAAPNAADLMLSPATLPIAAVGQPGVTAYADVTLGNGLTSNSVALTPGTVPTATQTQRGVARFASPDEVAKLDTNTYADTIKYGTVVAPATIPIASDQQRGVAQYATYLQVATELNTNGEDSDPQIRFRTMVSPGSIPWASQSQRGVARFATPGEAALLESLDTQLSPGTIPFARQDQIGLVELADQTEANALVDVVGQPRCITPGTLPTASRLQRGITQFASPDQAVNADPSDLAISPALVKALVRKMMESEIGTIKLFAGDTAPDGYLFCRGQEVLRTTYQKLFTVIGTIWGGGDGVNTFNLPPANLAVVAASTSSGYTVGTVGGSPTSSVTTTSDGVHVHTGTTTAEGKHQHVDSLVGDGGAHTPSVTMQSAGAHQHRVTGQPAGGVTPEARSTGSGAHFPADYITIRNSETHSHSVTVDSRGAFQPVVTLQPSPADQQIFPNAEPHLGHDHGYTMTPDGSYSVSGVYVNNGGDVTPFVSVLEGGSHSHGHTLTEAGVHWHVMDSNDSFSAGGGGNTAYGRTDTDGNHTHPLTIHNHTGHSHNVQVSSLPTHSHQIPDISIPPHHHALDVHDGGYHSHDIDPITLPTHNHGVSITAIPSHDHGTVAAGADGVHTHPVDKTQVANHTHPIIVDPILDHTHPSVLTTIPDPLAVDPALHTHPLTITEVLAHDHPLTITEEPDHTHDYTTSSEDGGHDHEVTVSTIQPYMAVNLIIYTGVHST